MASDDYRWHFDYTRLARDSGFAFQAHRSRPSLDQNIGIVDIEQVIRDRDIAAIEKHIGTIIEFTLDNDQTSVLDPSFVKIFRISQLAVQYLLFCKRYLDNTVVLVKQEFIRNNEETKNLKRYVDELKQELSNSRKQIKDLKASLNCQLASTQDVPVFQCNECPKAFSTEEYLLAHIKRRHGLLTNIGTAGTSFQAETDKLQMEIKQLKERLNNTEKYIHSSDESEKPKNDFIIMPNFPVKDNTAANTLLVDLQQKFEVLKVHVENELRILQTQKFDQEKYEKWFETFLNKLEQSHNIASIDIGKTAGSAGLIKANEPETVTVCKNCQGKSEIDEQTQTEIKTPNTSISKVEVKKTDNTTQTDLAAPFEAGVSKDFQARPTSKTREVKLVNVVDENSHDLQENMPQKLDVKPENQLEKFEEMLQEKVTGSIEKLENQMQSFWNRMNEMEKQKVEKVEQSPNKEPQDLQTNPLPVNTESPKVLPKPRKRVQLVKEAFMSSSPSQKSNPRLVKINPIPNEITKSAAIKSPKPPSQVVTPKEINKNRIISDSESEISEESASSSESESETDSGHSNDVILNVKTSAASMLGKRSLTSLKEAAHTPHVLQGLQLEVENILNNRLEELGVSPSWTTLPLRSYQRAMGIVTHQANLIQKNVANYKHIRGQILKNLEQVLDKKRNWTPRKDSKVKNTRSIGGVETNTNSESKYSRRPSASPKQKKNKIQKMKNVQEPVNNKPIARKNVQEPVNNNLVARMYMTDSESDGNARNKKPGAWNQTNLTDQTQKAYYDVIQELNTTVGTKIKQQESISDLSSDVSIKELKPPEIRKINESEDENFDVKLETQAKGVLKNYPSTGSLHKKKVLFDLESSDASVQKEPEKIAAPLKTNEGGSTTSIASSVFDGSKLNLNLQAPEKKQQELSDVSDWDLSEILDR